MSNNNETMSGTIVTEPTLIKGVCEFKLRLSEFDNIMVGCASRDLSSDCTKLLVGQKVVIKGYFGESMFWAEQVYKK